MAEPSSAESCVSDNPAIETVVRARPDTGTHFVLVRHADRAATTDDAAALTCTTYDGLHRIPVRVTGRNANLGAMANCVESID